MTKIANSMTRSKRVSLNNKSISNRMAIASTRGVRIVKKFKDKPLYKSSAGKILIYTDEKKDTDIIFRQPPKDKPVFKSEEGVVRNVFKK